MTIDKIMTVVTVCTLIIVVMQYLRFRALLKGMTLYEVKIQETYNVMDDFAEKALAELKEINKITQNIMEEYEELNNKTYTNVKKAGQNIAEKSS